MTRLTVFALVLIGVTACTTPPGGPSGTGEPGTTVTVDAGTTITAGSAETIDMFRGCLGDRGVVIEEIPLDARGRPRLDLVMATLDLTNRQVAAAITACADLLTRGQLDLVGDDSLRRIIVARLEAYGSCMRANGVEGLPEPVPGFAGVGPAFPVADIPYADPQLRSAAQFCRAKMLEDLELGP